MSKPDSNIDRRERRAAPKIIEKIDEFARDLSAFVAGFVVRSREKRTANIRRTALALIVECA
jgi:hypothetical protein